MKKLDDIPKNNIFQVPDGYFNQLPLQIQARTEKLSHRRPILSLNFSLRYVVPSLLAAIAIVYLLKTKTVQNTEELLASIPTEHLIGFLHESDINEQDLLEAVNFDNEDVDSLNSHVHKNFFLDDAEFDEYKNVLENEL